MADPFTWLVGAAVTQLAKMVINKQVDYAMLQQFKEQYEQLPDKRRRPGPKLRRVIAMLESGEMSMARDELKSFAHECCGLNEGPGWLELGQDILSMLPL
jgi:hypothetical protein